MKTNYKELYELTRLAYIRVVNHVVLNIGNRYTQEQVSEAMSFQNVVIAVNESDEEHPDVKKENYMTWKQFPELPSMINQKDLDYELYALRLKEFKTK